MKTQPVGIHTPPARIITLRLRLVQAIRPTDLSIHLIVFTVLEGVAPLLLMFGLMSLGVVGLAFSILGMPND